MPFGYSQAPRVFTKLLETALEPLKKQGCQILAYLDDILSLAGSRKESMELTMKLVTQLETLGFSINWKKSTPIPVQTTEYLGLRLNTVAMTAKPSVTRRTALMELLHHFLVTPRIRAHTAQVLPLSERCLWWYAYGSAELSIR